MKTVMIIEDMPDLQMLFKILVEKLGYVAITANGGEDAEQKLSILKEKPFLILCDMMMPGDGWNFIHRIALNHTLVTIPIVAMSAANVKEPPAHARVFVKKPFTLDALTNVIKEFERTA